MTDLERERLLEHWRALRALPRWGDYYIEGTKITKFENGEYKVYDTEAYFVAEADLGAEIKHIMEAKYLRYEEPRSR